jgi:hypothetical protein
MEPRKLPGWISHYRWPLYLMGLLVLAISAQAVLVYFATRPDAPRPIKDYYRKSMEWDVESAVQEASNRLEWAVTVDIPSGQQYEGDMARPVDVQVKDRGGLPVSGLKGDLVALRPADTRMNTRGGLTELPHAPGTYRTLLRLPAPGFWEIAIDARQESLRFVHKVRIEIPADGETP